MTHLKCTHDEEKYTYFMLFCTTTVHLICNITKAIL